MPSTPSSYRETLDYLYSRLPMFQKVGSAAFKYDLSNIAQFCDLLGNPQDQYPSIHIAGTNGKGSSSHMLAAILQAAGYKVGLYTSPHLKSFTERIKVNGQEIAKAQVVKFVQANQARIESKLPSFFEITVAMAFQHFAQEKVDIAVIEVGLGGRLDATNIITPEVGLITNISYDHQQFLGDTLELIAGEKAGIMKPNIPIVIGERQPETTAVFEQKSQEVQASLFFAQDDYAAQWVDVARGTIQINHQQKALLPPFEMSLKGGYQEKNVAGVLKVIELLQQKESAKIPWDIRKEHIVEGLKDAANLTQLKGRWQILQQSPFTVCDTAHNEAGLSQVIAQLKHLTYQQLHIVLGTVNDKKLDKILPLFPSEATYYFCAPKIPRALTADKLQAQASQYNLRGEVFASVNQAYQQAQTQASAEDVVFVGGSTFVVAEIEGL
ncbi:MAG TPA: dihydrofolate synthase [Microscillaceae bacterium]|nr:dihydrofolate synthase [Microscillaceae bacterium]